jgi:hypothetical protein
MKCECCENEHDASYGSGRFCSLKCARGFSTKAKRQEINAAVSKRLKGLPGRPQSYPSAETVDKIKQTWENKMMTAAFESLGYDTKRRRILLEQEGKCNHCGISEWQGKPIILEVDHINGIGNDDRRVNLEAICPNCHSVTDTWRGRNKPRKNGENKVADKDLIEALEKHSNIRQALLSVGLAAKGNNYSRAKKLLS